MVQKIRSLLWQLRQLCLKDYIYLNYFCKSVRRCGKGKIVPYKNAVIDLAPDSEIVVGDVDLQIGTNKLKGSKTETYLRLRSGACWNACGGCLISYGATIEILQNAVLKSDYFTMNSFSVLIADQQINIGDDVMIGRNVVIYDSDFHSIESSSSMSKPVTIGNHVWIATNATILKGVSISDGAIIAANTMVLGNISSCSMVAEKHETTVQKEKVQWHR